MKRIIFFLSFFIICVRLVTAQKPFEKDVMAFKMQDSLNMPAPGAVLFIGSSSFTRWTDLAASFPRSRVLNRAFGGSTLPDVIRYADQVIFPYQPSQVVIYCGENDMASDTVAAAVVKNRFVQLFTVIRQQLPTVPVIYVSMKPSPSRIHIMNKIEAGNKLIRRFLRQQPHTTFVNVYDKMLNRDQRPISALFVEDSLHMNKKGYAIWQKKIEPHLLKK